MSKSKRDESMSLNLDQCEMNSMNISEDYAKDMSLYLSNNDILSVIYTCKRNYFFYQPILEIKLALTYVLQGELALFLALIQKKPSLFFEKLAEINGHKGQRFFNVSPYQLIQFLCDRDMKQHVLPLISKIDVTQHEKQYAQMRCGGPDLIRLDRNPENFGNFKELLQCEQSLNYGRNVIPYDLLENTDGIICCIHEKNKQFYYVNKETEEIRRLDIQTQYENTNEFEQFKASFDDMENNSSRRSSNQEHELIKEMLQCNLVRMGIVYAQNGILYKDTQAPFFNLLNTYRRCFGLTEFVSSVSLYSNKVGINEYSRKILGEAQVQSPIWILQRFCERYKPFDKFASNYLDNFERSLDVGLDRGKEVLLEVVGSTAVLSKGQNWCRAEKYTKNLMPLPNMEDDFFATFKYIEDGKANIVESILEPKSQTQYTNIS